MCILISVSQLIMIVGVLNKAPIVLESKYVAVIRNRFELYVNKRVIDLFNSLDMVKQITFITIELGVNVEVTILIIREP